MRSTRSTGIGVFAVAAALALAACGTDEPASGGVVSAPDTEAAPESTMPTNDETAQVDVGEPAGEPAPEPNAEPASEPAEPVADEPAVEVQPAVLGGRALGEAIVPESEVETNLLPDLVVDDVGRDAKVNVRNVFPADRPVLMWMWAPH